MPSTLHREPINPQVHRGLFHTENRALLPPLSTLEVSEVRVRGLEWRESQVERGGVEWNRVEQVLALTLAHWHLASEAPP